MYLTAHRVSAPGGRQTGTNCFRYDHKQSAPEVDWKAPDLAKLVEELPGTLVSSRIEVPPGGNDVHSYLDIVCSDTTSAEAIEAALDEQSLTRLQTIHGTGWNVAEVSVSETIHRQLQSRPAELCPHIASVLTCLPMDSLMPLGGIQFLDEDSEKLLWEWPTRAPLQGYCLSCHQHGTLRAEEGGMEYRCASCGNIQQTDGLWVATLT